MQGGSSNVLQWSPCGEHSEPVGDSGSVGVLVVVGGHETMVSTVPVMV
jgi:hypothetical protein